MTVVRWLLLLSPSALVIGTPLIGALLEHSPIAESRKFFLTLTFINILVEGILCFGFGVCVEYWLRGKINSVVWALNYGFMILFANGFITFAVAVVFIPTQVR